MTETNDIVLTEEAAETPAETPAEPKPRKKRKGLVILGTIVVVVALAAVGMIAWHNQPSFCGAICHNPMDGYLATYSQAPHAEGFDKWGNDVADTSAMLAVSHAAEGITCLDCHTATMSQQIHEATAWISGNFVSYDNDMFPSAIDERSLTQLMVATGGTGEEFCLREGCHEYAREDLGALTADYAYNPHDNHYSLQLDCSECHKAQRASVLFCTNCHSGLKIPEGWLTMSEYGQLDHLY